MADRHFLDLTADDQRDVYRAMSAQLNRPAEYLEKDVWLCWTLDVLFRMSDVPGMAFKGGTSLSKVYGAIQRFSEDLDITLNPYALATDFDPFPAETTGGQRAKLGERLRSRTREVVAEGILPILTDAIAAVGGTVLANVDEAATLHVHYASVLGAGDESYARPQVILEFGGRNETTPAQRHTITADMAPALPLLSFPSATIDVLSAARTFWEKATLIHAHNSKPQGKDLAERQSRHWSDLAMLADTEIGATALADRALLADVIRVKEIHFRTATTQYSHVIGGRARLVPKGQTRKTLADDYAAMESMFIGTPRPFEEILTRLAALETLINADARTQERS